MIHTHAHGQWIQIFNYSLSASLVCLCRAHSLCGLVQSGLSFRPCFPAPREPCFYVYLFVYPFISSEFSTSSSSGKDRCRSLCYVSVFPSDSHPALLVPFETIHGHATIHSGTNRVCDSKHTLASRTFRPIKYRNQLYAHCMPTEESSPIMSASSIIVAARAPPSSWPRRRSSASPAHRRSDSAA
jgi:hypothetical protein